MVSQSLRSAGTNDSDLHLHKQPIIGPDLALTDNQRHRFSSHRYRLCAALSSLLYTGCWDSTSQYRGKGVVAVCTDL
jgi:hypothetical protein